MSSKSFPFDTSLLSSPSEYEAASTPELTADQITKLQDIDDHFSKPGYELPIAEGSLDEEPLGQREMMYLSRETFIRFLTATKGDFQAAITRLEAYIIWRRTVNIDNLDLMAEKCEEESRTGKNMVQGFSKTRQPILYFFPNRNMTPIDQRKAVHAIFMLERAVDLKDAGSSGIIIVFNFSGKRQGPPTSISVARETLYILANYYPETLFLCIFQDLPWVVKAFVNLMWPFVDPATKKKVRFESSADSSLVKDGIVEGKYLLKGCGGGLDSEYDHETYWPEMLVKCREQREEHLLAWRALGAAKAGREEKLWRRAAIRDKSSAPAEAAPAQQMDSPNAEEIVR